jgi:hypothetical protein
MRSENIPHPGSEKPQAPHDPPDPAPQAAAWRRALRVIGTNSTAGKAMRSARTVASGTRR